MSDKRESWFISIWKKSMKDHIKIVYPNSKDKFIEKVLDKIIKDKLNNPDVELVNNYKQYHIKTNALSIIDLIMNKNLIIGGGACIFVQHDQMMNPLIAYITNIMGLRKMHKKQRDEYEKYSALWLIEELLQKNFKIKINALYGVLGYHGFILFNIFLAESVTNMGQNIITAASTGFENFLADNVPLFNMDELFHYINNIKKEYEEKYTNFDFCMIPDIKVYEVYKRLKNKCSFHIDEKRENTILSVLNGFNKDLLKLIYFKNNFFKFNLIPFIQDKLIFIMDNINVLMTGELSGVKNRTVSKVIEDLWKFYEMFVFYNYPTFDRVRKGKYINRKVVLYVDTDSNMIGLNNWVQFVLNKIIPKCNNIKMNKNEIEYTSSNLMTIYLSNVVASVLQTMCDNMNISREYSKKLMMKNEFYFRRMLFIPRKKRYIAQMILQEGKILNNGLGFPEIKGFDFIKATTKEFLRERYTDICLNDILMSDEINVTNILKKVFDIKNEIQDSINKGETKFYKQANVSIFSHYKKPYSVQGIKGVTLWNCLVPEYSIELPLDVDIVPIKTINNPYKIIKEEVTDINGNIIDTKIKYDYNTIGKLSEGAKLLEEQYPDIFNKIDKEIWKNEDIYVCSMSLNCLAKPKNNDINLPEWYFKIIDSEKIIDDAIKLFAPIIQSLGAKVTSPSNKISHISNIVSI